VFDISRLLFFELLAKGAGGLHTCLRGLGAYDKWEIKATFEVAVAA
jgi:hypothetical protein